MTLITGLLAAFCLYVASCLGGSADHATRRDDGDPELSRWAADKDAYWEQLSAHDDARNDELDRKDEARHREGIFGAIDDYRAAHHESPRTTGDVKQWGNPKRDRGDVIVVSQEVEDDFYRRHMEAMKRRWAGVPDEDKEAEEAVRGGL